jgi:hypothetical protein
MEDCWKKRSFGTVNSHRSGVRGDGKPRKAGRGDQLDAARPPTSDSKCRGWKDSPAPATGR